MTKVKDILARKGQAVCTIGPKATALDAAHEMNDRRIGSLVVVEGERLVGIITERDVLQRIVAEERDPGSTLVDVIMTRELATCTPDTPAEQCREVMSSRRIRRLPVVVKGRLEGIVTQGDILAQEIIDHQQTIKQLNEYMESPPIPSGS